LGHSLKEGTNINN